MPVRVADRLTSKREPPRAKARWGRFVMRTATIAAACVGLALLVSGCDPNDRTYFRNGIGTELYTADTASATEFQNIYLDYLCRQSSSYVGADAPGCPQPLVPDHVWPVIVQAGLNDIDARCDSYLAWLDQKRRENAGILTEIGAVRFAVDALTNPAVVTGVSPVALAAISAAFGLATSTVNNFNSLLLQVDHTTVQNVVFNNRHDFRENLVKLSSTINNKPMAIHTLRTYLTICMPMTISANINSTVTVFQQTGFVGSNRPLSPTIGVPFAPRDKFAERAPPDNKISIVPGAETIIAGYPGNARTYPPEVIRNILSSLCAPDTEMNGITGISAALLDIWERTDTLHSKIDGKISDRERKVLLGLTACPIGILNAFERVTFSTPDDVVVIVNLLNKAPIANSQLKPTATLSDARPRIALVRQRCFAGKLKKLPDSMNMQVTPDLMSALADYATTRAAAEARSLSVPAC
jgi:hypothetical protein